MRVALYQPDIAGNLGTILRTCACLDVPVDIIEPCGFPFSERALKRSGMDYLDQVDFTRHADWPDFLGTLEESARLVLLSSKASEPLHRFAFQPGDTLLFGSESAGVPDHVRDCADARIAIPICAPMRSLNVAVAVGMTLAEALHQTGRYPA